MARKSKFPEFYRPMFPRLLELVEVHALTQNRVAEILDQEGFTTELGGRISQTVVSKCLAVARYERRLALAKVDVSRPPAPAVSTAEYKPKENPVAKPELSALIDSQTVSILESLKQLEQKQQDLLELALNREKRQEELLDAMRKQLAETT